MLAGPIVFRDAHEYFLREVAPLLDAERQYIGPIDSEDKVRLLATARCLLVPSACPETSSLTSMEAISCGVPVVAYASGALCETVEHGVTGFLVKSDEAMAQAVKYAAELSPFVCRTRAEARFDGRRMTSGYLDAYEREASRKP